MAAEVKEFVFDWRRTPNIGSITVLRERFAAPTFRVAAMTNSELTALMEWIASAKPYHRAMLEQFLVERLSGDWVVIWSRFKGSTDGNTLAFYARYYRSQGDSEEVDRIPYFKQAYALGERYHSAFALAENSTRTERFHDMFDMREDFYSAEAVKFLEEACSAGNPDAYIILIDYFRLFRKDCMMAANLMLKRIGLGERLAECSDYSEGIERFRLDKYNLGVFSAAIDSLPNAEKLLGAVGATYIAIEEQIASKVMDQYPLRYEEKFGGWEESEFNSHSQFLVVIMSSIIEKFGGIGLKMITDYYTVLNNSVLTAEILLFVANFQVAKVYVIMDHAEAFKMVFRSAKLNNRSAYKFLTRDRPSNERQIVMCNKFRHLALSD